MTFFKYTGGNIGETGEKFVYSPKILMDDISSFGIGGS